MLSDYYKSIVLGKFPGTDSVRAFIYAGEYKHLDALTDAMLQEAFSYHDYSEMPDSTEKEICHFMDTSF